MDIRWAVGGVVLWGLVVSPAAVLAADGVLDGTFSGDGRQSVDFALVNGGDDRGAAVTVDSGGRVVLAGRAAWSATDDDFAFARLLANGSLDAGFSGDGRATVAFDAGPSGHALDRAGDVAIQRDGAIVACGFVEVDASGGRELAVVRLLDNGAADPSFSGDGRLLVNPLGGAARYEEECSIVVRASGAIAVAWTTDDLTTIGILQLTSTGSLDPGFGSGGVLSIAVPGETKLTDLALWFPSGSEEVVATGYLSTASTEGLDALLLTTGNGVTYSSGFLDNPEPGTSERGVGLATQSDGALILGMTASGSGFSRGSLVRLTAFGLDSSFGLAGWANVDLASGPSEIDELLGIVVQSDDRIVPFGYTRTLSMRDCVLERFDADGQGLDASFGTAGRTTVSFTTGAVVDDCVAAAIGDGRVVTGGLSDLQGDLDFISARLTSQLIYTDGFEIGSGYFWSAIVP